MDQSGHPLIAGYTRFRTPFVAKISPNGDVVFTTGSSVPGPTNFGQVLAMANDGDGNIYITGQFKGEIGFGDGALNAPAVLGKVYDIFVAKLNRDGDHLWSKSFGD